jgi:hypothetical protein
MKQAADKFTADLFSSPRRGRPPKLAPKTNAQRQREFRQRRKFDFLISVTRNGNSNTGES